MVAKINRQNQSPKSIANGALWTPTEPYGTPWNPTEPYGTLWSPMKPYRSLRKRFASRVQLLIINQKPAPYMCFFNVYQPQVSNEAVKKISHAFSLGAYVM